MSTIHFIGGPCKLCTDEHERFLRVSHSKYGFPRFDFLNTPTVMQDIQMYRTCQLISSPNSNTIPPSPDPGPYGPFPKISQNLETGEIYPATGELQFYIWPGMPGNPSDCSGYTYAPHGQSHPIGYHWEYTDEGRTAKLWDDGMVAVVYHFELSDPIPESEYEAVMNGIVADARAQIGAWDGESDSCWLGTMRITGGDIFSGYTYEVRTQQIACSPKSDTFALQSGQFGVLHYFDDPTTTGLRQCVGDKTVGYAMNYDFVELKRPKLYARTLFIDANQYLLQEDVWQWQNVAYMSSTTYFTYCGCCNVLDGCDVPEIFELRGPTVEDLFINGVQYRKGYFRYSFDNTCKNVVPTEHAGDTFIECPPPE
jgi:hypothetical protein